MLHTPVASIPDCIVFLTHLLHSPSFDFSSINNLIELFYLLDTVFYKIVESIRKTKSIINHHLASESYRQVDPCCHPNSQNSNTEKNMLEFQGKER